MVFSFPLEVLSGQSKLEVGEKKSIQKKGVRLKEIQGNSLLLIGF